MDLLWRTSYVRAYILNTYHYSQSITEIRLKKLALYKYIKENCIMFILRKTEKKY